MEWGRRSIARRLAHDAEKSLGPAPRERLERLLRPGWSRTTAARRVVAVLLLACAVALLIRDGVGRDRVPVVVAAHDLSPGRLLGPGDIDIVDRPPDALPEGAVSGAASVLRQTVTGPVRRGEIITDLRLLGPRSAAAAAGVPDARMVPIRLPEAALTDLIREGDRVDVLAADPDRADLQPQASTLAVGAVVVLVPNATGGRTGAGDRIVLIALPAEQAAAVAAASLTRTVTVTLH
ncbi:SAF domain-containing protein [Speluncibacter jeojiensis]|uniref:SAF domain-containing protein n=1 Tax=Speluncibacter jeojiensis TaxID=2710754 RepID=A0A9X4M0L3_9ACTN|nr:SAF domain-containing protein [Corynebacteriales bacterium D3-21]